MKLKLAMIITTGLAVGAVADNFIWLNADKTPMMSTENSDTMHGDTQKERIADPNIGYYIDAQKDRVVALVDLEKNSVTKTDQKPPKELEIGMQRNTIMTKVKAEQNNNSESMRLW